MLQAVDFDSVAGIIRVRGKNLTESDWVKVSATVPLRHESG